VVRDLKGEGPVVIATGFEKLIEAGHGALSALVDNEIARDGEEPGLESGLAVELGAARKNAHPDFLENVFGLFAIAGQEKKVAEKTVLEPYDELIKQGRIFAFKSFCYCEILLPDLLVCNRGSARGEDRAYG
jgi:hypothetical protein